MQALATRYHNNMADDELWMYKSDSNALYVSSDTSYT